MTRRPLAGPGRDGLHPGRRAVAFRQLMLGLACGTVAGAVATAVGPVSGWWWAVALGVACLVWAGPAVARP